MCPRQMGRFDTVKKTKKALIGSITIFVETCQPKTNEVDKVGKIQTTHVCTYAFIWKIHSK